MRTINRSTLTGTFHAGPLDTYLSRSADTLKQTVAEMSADGLDAAPFAAAMQEAEAGEVDLRTPELTWAAAGAGITATLVVPYAGDTLALSYDGTDRREGRISRRPPAYWQMDYEQQFLVATRDWAAPPDPSEVTTWRDEALTDLRTRVGRSNDMIRAHNESLEDLASQESATRRAGLAAMQALTEELGPPTQG